MTKPLVDKKPDHSHILEVALIILFLMVVATWEIHQHVHLAGG
jgi:hypothetical protein